MKRRRLPCSSRRAVPWSPPRIVAGFFVEALRAGLHLWPTSGPTVWRRRGRILRRWVTSTGCWPRGSTAVGAVRLRARARERHRDRVRVAARRLHRPLTQRSGCSAVRTAQSASGVSWTCRRRLRQLSAAAGAREACPGERWGPRAAVGPAVRSAAAGVAADVRSAPCTDGSRGMRTGVARGHVGNFHEAGFYSSDAEFLSLIVPFVTDGMAGGEPVVIGYDDRKCDLLRAALPRSDEVTFIVDKSLYASPAGAIEAYRRQFERHLAAGAGQIRIAGDVPHEGNGGRFAGWDRYESVVNPVWQDYPVWSRCLYDATAVPGVVRDVVERTHRRLVTPDGHAAASPRYQEVGDFQGLRPAADPAETTPPSVTLVDASLKRTRRRVADL